MTNNWAWTARAWRAVPAGWYVQAPDGTSLEVLETRQEGGRQLVTLRFPDGRTAMWPRVPSATVACRRGEHGSDAVDALFAAFPASEVIEDQVS